MKSADGSRLVVLLGLASPVLLALALGLDLGADIMQTQRLLWKRGSYVELRTPKERQVGRSGVDPDAETFSSWVDRLHTAMLVQQQEGSEACQRWLVQHGFAQNATFRALMEAAIKVVPPAKDKGAYTVEEAETMEAIRAAVYPELAPAPSPEAQQTTMF